MQSARVVFAGTPEFAVPCLAALIAAGVTVSAVLTQPDRPAGRGRSLQASPVKQLALAHTIEVLQPSVLDDDFRHRLPEARPHLLVVVAYGLILPTWLLDWPTIAPINVHASLLPRWRGAAPVQHAILAGDAETGISIMRMTAGLDRGPVYRQTAAPIGRDETAGELHDRLAGEGAALLVDVLPSILSQTLEPSPQDDALATYAPKISKRDAVLDWTLPARDLERRVRAYNPWPVAEARTADGARLRILQAEVVDDASSAAPGTVVGAAGAGIDVATTRGLLRLKRVQSPGGRIVAAAAYLAARDLTGARFVGPG